MNVSVSITESTSGTNLSGVVHVVASASPSPIRVEYFLDDKLVFSDTTSPYEWAWDTTQTTDGTHIIRAEAVYKSRRSKTQLATTVKNVAYAYGFGIEVFGTLAFRSTPGLRGDPLKIPGKDKKGIAVITNTNIHRIN